MVVYLVKISDCESSIVVGVYKNKSTAEKALFVERDKLIAEAKEQLETYGHDVFWVEHHALTLENLSGDNYIEWNNYPHETPILHEWEVIED